MLHPDAPEGVAAKNRWLATLQQDRAVLLARQPFVAAIAMNLELVPVLDDRLQTACTDGSRIFFSVDFLQTLPDSHRLALIGHEVWHCVAGHFLRHRIQRDSEAAADLGQTGSGTEPPRPGFWSDADLWNYACDHEVNHLLLSDRFALPAGAVFYPPLAGRNAEQVYQWLKESGAPGGQLMDQHEFSQDTDNPDRSQPRQDRDFHPEPSEARRQQQHRKLINTACTIRQTQPGSLSREGRELLDRLLEQRRDWRDLLRQFIQSDSSPEKTDWQRPNRRYLAQGLFLPRRRGEKLNLLVAVDLSGSTCDLLPMFLAELVAIAESYMSFELTLLTFDTRVLSREVFTPFNLQALKARRFAPCGGTDFGPVFQQARQEQPTAMICFTDGYAAPVAQPPFPVLWLLPKGCKPPVAWGGCIEMPEQ